MLKIVKASAGSGKTYLLSHTYIDLLLGSADPDEFRHVLAVTFTNKATDEMKERILKDLFDISCDKSDPRAAKAGSVLHRILHDYGSFSVSTIDSFFQQTLRAFAHETGHWSTSGVELAKDSLIDEAVDSILDSLDENDAEDAVLLDFITECMEEQVSDGKSLNMDKALKEVAGELRSEEFWAKSKEMGLDMGVEYSPEKLNAMKRNVASIRFSFEEDMRGRAGEIVDAAASVGCRVENFRSGVRGWFNYFVKLSAGGTVARLDDGKKEKALDPEQWFSKAEAFRLPEARAAIGGLLKEFCRSYDASYPLYVTAGIISRSIYGLGIAQRLDSAFDSVTSSRNVICLDESNRLLKDIIDGSDAPFVYERTGTRLSHYLLDEFQDTSLTQWANFRPLLLEAVANDAATLPASSAVSNLIVGDVKQSIYRWRGSDWSLLDSCVPEEFPRAAIDSICRNFRSREHILEFNNSFYPYLASRLDALFGGNRISSIYSDVVQEVGKDGQKGGSVEITFCQDVEEELDRVVEVVQREISEHGARPGDIAVLVRKKDKGSKVAARLIASGIKVETESSFRLKSSVCVRRLVSMLSYVGNPDDLLNGYVASRMDMTEVPTSFHSLSGLCDELYSIMASNPAYSGDCRREVVFISAFMDTVRDYAAKNGDRLCEFLKYWEENDPTVSSPLSSDAVRILTIHKSKGLAFPYVIVPFLEDLKLYEPTKTVKWCKGELDGTPLAGYGSLLFRVRLSSQAADSAFREDYLKENFNQAIDAVNLMYVATTRARSGMTLISRSSSSENERSLGHMLSSYTGGQDRFLGEATRLDEPGDGAEERRTEDCGLEYDVFPVGGRLRVRPYAAEYFSEQGNDFGHFPSVKRGIVLHDILSGVIVPSDLDAAVSRAVDNGSLCSSDAPSVRAFLSEAIASRPEFYPTDASGALPEGFSVMNEMPILCPDGTERRPDRVIADPQGRLTVVDYKFGSERAEYDAQISEYSSLLKAMGYEQVTAKLWFVYKNYLR